MAEGWREGLVRGLVRGLVEGLGIGSARRLVEGFMIEMKVRWLSELMWTIGKESRPATKQLDAFVFAERRKENDAL